MRPEDLSHFIEYAVTGLRDGLMDTLHMIQGSQFETAWRGFIHDKFADRKYKKKTVFKRRRELMLGMPLDAPLTLEGIPMLTSSLARQYSQLSKRTLERDLEVLKEMELVVQVEDTYLANSAVLKQMIPRRLE